MNKIRYGEYQNSGLYQVTLGDRDDFLVTLLSMGATLKNISVKPKGHKSKEKRDVLLSYRDNTHYLQNPHYLGSTLGRLAGRTENGVLFMRDKKIALDITSHPHALHSGQGGFSKQNWQLEKVTPTKAVFVLGDFYEQGKTPANIQVRVEYNIIRTRTLRIMYEAQADADTVINMSNHAYFCLDGPDRGIAEQELFINAEQYYKTDKNQIALFPALPVKATPFDFRNSKKIKEALDSEHEDIVAAQGLDHAFVLNKEELYAVVLKGQDIALKISSNQNACVVYSGNVLHQNPIPDLKTFFKHAGISFETQNIFAADAAPILLKDTVYRHITEYEFVF